MGSTTLRAFLSLPVDLTETNFFYNAIKFDKSLDKTGKFDIARICQASLF